MKISILFLFLFWTNTWAYEKIVSVVPALTEIAFELGAGEKIVGISSYCTYPDEVKRLPKVGTLFTPNIEKLSLLKPDLVLTQIVQKKDFESQMQKLKIPFRSFPLTSYTDLKNTIRDMAKLLDLNARLLIGKIEKEEKSLKSLDKKGRFLVIINSKMMSKSGGNLVGAGSGSYLAEIFSLSGLKNWFSETNGYKNIGLEGLAVDPPEYVFIFHRDIKKALPKTIKNVIILNPEHALIPGPRVHQFMAEISNKLRL